LTPAYVPDAGDIVWLQFSPRAGHEQAGHRPAIVLSPLSYNRKTGLMLWCPVTTKVKHYPFEVAIAGNPSSAALADQIKSFDWRARGAKPKGKIGALELAEIRGKATALLAGR
jgi:mRNA interferase MazF